MSGKRIGLGGFVAATLTSAILIAPATGTEAKQAGATAKACPDEALCLWAKPDFEGKKVVIKEKGYSNALANQMNNRASSLKNRYTGLPVFLFDKRDGEGDKECFFETKYPSLKAPYNFNNQATSTLLPKENQGPVCL